MVLNHMPEKRYLTLHGEAEEREMRRGKWEVVRRDGIWTGP